MAEVEGRLCWGELWSEITEESFVDDSQNDVFDNEVEVMTTIKQSLLVENADRQRWMIVKAFTLFRKL